MRRKELKKIIHSVGSIARILARGKRAPIIRNGLRSIALTSLGNFIENSPQRADVSWAMEGNAGQRDPPAKDEGIVRFRGETPVLAKAVPYWESCDMVPEGGLERPKGG